MQFIDDRLVDRHRQGAVQGFIMVLVLLGSAVFFLQFGVQALVIRGLPKVAAVMGFAAFVLIFYLGGVARFRALRYRLSSRTYWHGIRGGSDDGGWSYGWSYMWRNIVGMIPLYLMVPWAAMISLWNERWNKMSFGPHGFQCSARVKPVFKRFLLFYLAPFLIVLVVLAYIATIGGMIGNVAAYQLPARNRSYCTGGHHIGCLRDIGLIALAY